MDTLQELSDPHIAAHSQRFFKTGPGEYGEGDRFLGIRVPTLRKCVGRYRTVSLEETLELLKSPYHEVRLFALLMLVTKYASERTRAEKETIYRSYLRHTPFINNWDLVDASAAHIVGAYLFDKDRKPIYRLIRSSNLWERRIGVMATFHFVKRADFSDTLAIAECLLHDKEALIHKAAGWMLREVGKRNRDVEEGFLLKHYKAMPRTMLRYAIEKFPEADRQAYLQGNK
ncbi:MAG: DNA alkylation repair protein [Nitrospiria bacterium]